MTTWQLFLQQIAAPNTGHLIKCGLDECTNRFEPNGRKMFCCKRHQDINQGRVKRERAMDRALQEATE